MPLFSNKYYIIKMKNNKIFHTIIAFTSPRLIKNLNYIIASSHYLINPINFYFNSELMVKRLNLFYDDKLIIYIIDNYCEGEEIKEYKINYSSTNDYNLIIIPTKNFYTKKIITDLLINNKNINHSIFLFKNIGYKEIVVNLTLFDIIISGGSNSKKHMISPIQMRLARFLIAISNFSSNEVANSFHFDQHKNKQNLD